MTNPSFNIMFKRGRVVPATVMNIASSETSGMISTGQTKEKHMTDFSIYHKNSQRVNFEAA